MEINKLIKAKRDEKGYTMKELAEKIGVSESAISRWENGEIDNMKRKNIYSLSKVLGINPSVIMGWEEPKNRIEDKLLSKFHQLTPANQTTILSMIDVLLSQQDSQKETVICG